MTHCDSAHFPLAWHGPVQVVENLRVARDTYRIRLVCPDIARRILPGQFIMLRLAGCNDPLLGRPLAAYDVLLGADRRPESIDVVYITVGRMTRRLAEVCPGAALEAWGPLGNGFAPRKTQHLVMVAGGIGLTPFLTVAKEYLGRAVYGDPPRAVEPARKVSLCYGVRSAESLACVDDYRQSGVEVHLSTEDGSLGHRGLVIDLVEPVVLAGAGISTRILCCGPEPMMKATGAIAARLGVPCEVSLETPMACGIGICFSCVAKIRDASGQWDYRRTCVEGPVFNAEDVEL